MLMILFQNINILQIITANVYFVSAQLFNRPLFSILAKLANMKHMARKYQSLEKLFISKSSYLVLASPLNHSVKNTMLFQDEKQ